VRSQKRFVARAVPASLVAGLSALVLGACGTEGITVADSDPAYDGAVLFSERCSGCHTLTPAGTQGSANRALRVQGPNLDQRRVNYEDALFAIRNGGFSGAIMPQNIVVGDDAEAVARFVEQYSGTDVEEPPVPSSEAEPSQAETEAEEADIASEQQPSGQAEAE
jgi:mono/diheme cytochrome c family protein